MELSLFRKVGTQACIYTALVFFLEFRLDASFALTPYALVLKTLSATQRLFHLAPFLSYIQGLLAFGTRSSVVHLGTFQFPMLFT